MVDDPLFSQADRQRFSANLPWYLNGKLPSDERGWMDHALQRSAWASYALAIERELDHSVAAPDPADADLGLATLLARVQRERRDAMPRRPGALERLSDWLAQPRLAMAMSVLLVAQAAVIGWQAFAPGSQDDMAMRSTPVTEVRTLRVTFVPGATEPQLRAALQSAGAQVVGGPTQLGEYWLASGIRSLGEMKTSLQASGLTSSIEVDVVGPLGR